MHPQSTSKRVCRRWHLDEDAYLRTHYLTQTTAEMARLLARSKSAVRERKHVLSLNSKNKLWTVEDVRALRDAYEACGPQGFLDLPALSAQLGRTPVALCLKAGELGLTCADHRTNRKVGRIDRRKYKTAEERHHALSEQRKRQIAEHGHPRGALGMKHSAESRAKMSASVCASWARAKETGTSHMDPRTRQSRSDLMAMRQQTDPRLRQGFSRGAGGTREDLGFYVRSRWEANVARYLKWLQGKGEIHSWSYEPKTFWFEQIKRGTRSYTPDFEIVEREGAEPYYWEVKGFKHPRGQTALARMARYYPQVRIVVVDQDAYKGIAKWKALIPNWEYGNGSHKNL